MEHQESTFTTREGAKVHFIPPPPKIEEEAAEQRKREFELAQKLLEGLPKRRRDAETQDKIAA